MKTLAKGVLQKEAKTIRNFVRKKCYNFEKKIAKLFVFIPYSVPHKNAKNFVIFREMILFFANQIYEKFRKKQFCILYKQNAEQNIVSRNFCEFISLKRWKPKSQTITEPN